VIGTSYQKSVLHARRHRKHLESIYAKREDICHFCAFFVDGRFCGNPKNAEEAAWADQSPAPRMPMVSHTQGCEGWERRVPYTIREPDPAEADERRRYWNAQNLNRA
jgi:hypothetical protein